VRGHAPIFFFARKLRLHAPDLETVGPFACGERLDMESPPTLATATGG